jgi:hypothetical protein
MAPKMSFVGNDAVIRGVVTDWGGVLTTPILSTVQAWIQADGIDWDSYVAVMRPWVFGAYQPEAAPNPVQRLERGECENAEFEAILAARLLTISGQRYGPGDVPDDPGAAPGGLAYRAAVQFVGMR